MVMNGTVTHQKFSGLPAVFGAKDAADSRLTWHQRYRSGLSRPHRGIRVARPDAVGSVEVALKLAHQDRSLIVSHDTAGMMWGLWLPSRLQQGPIHLSRIRGKTGIPRIAGTVGHLLPLTEDDVRTIRRSRATSPAWTWTDLPSRGLSLEELVAAGDSLLQRFDGPPRPPGSWGGNPLSSLEELRSVVRRRGRVPGARLMREALDLMRPGADSAQESRLRCRLVEAGWPEPDVNPMLEFADGLRIRPDLVYRQWRVAIQYEGRHHFEDAAQYRRDISRDASLRMRGWEPIRVAADVFTPGPWSRFLEELTIAVRRQDRVSGVEPR